MKPGFSMSAIGWALEHHALTVLMYLLVIWFCASVLRQRRPAGSAVAWLLAIFLIPYVGIPLYLMLGGRKFRLRAGSKAGLAGRAQPGGLGPLDSVRAVDWLDDGVAAYKAFLDEINRAKKSIHIATFLVGRDETGRSLLQALARRAREGVQVRLLLDDLLRFEAPKDALAELVEAGGKTARFMPLVHWPFRGQTNLRNHRKIAVFDGERAIVGGMNLADEYMGAAPSPTRWRDLSVRLEGHAVARLDEIFRADWKFAAHEILQAPPGEASAANIAADAARKEHGLRAVRVVPSGPDSASDPIYDAMLTLAFSAKRRFWVATPYFVPDDSLAKALEIAARRGVDVRIILPAKSNHLLADLVGAPYLRDLATIGVKVLRFPRMMHAKTVLADEETAAVGSANFDMRSLFLDYEIALFFSGEAEVRRMAEWFDATCRECAAGPVRERATHVAVESIARLLAPLL